MMKENKWVWVAALAAIVAAVTTVAIFLLRARQKALCGCEDMVCDCCCDEDDDACCCEDACECAKDAVDEVVDQIDDMN